MSTPETGWEKAKREAWAKTILETPFTLNEDRPRSDTAQGAKAEAACFKHIGPEPKIRTFATGATRDKDDHKNDYEGFFSPLVFRRYGNYMQEHRKQKDGSVRDSDNWQKGMGLAAFMKSKWRHFVDIWTIFDGYEAIDFDGAKVDLEDALCADLFNTMGYLHEVLKAKLEKQEEFREGDAYKPKYPQTPMSYTSHCPNCSRVAAECICTKGPSEVEPTKE